MRAYYADMADPTDPIYYVRATNPTNEQVAFKGVGMAVAHAKAAELRMSGHRYVVMSVSDPGGAPVKDAQDPLLVE
jgi:hypothetical protein